MTPDLSFGAWLRRQRRHLDLTQEDLANQVGCSPITIRKLEGDERRPSKQLAERLAQTLAIPSAEQARFLTLARAPLTATAPLQPPTGPVPNAWSPQPQHHDWGEAPDVTAFYGRTTEQATLSHWVLVDHCRLVTLLGMGGMGKTALATTVAQQLAPAFPFVIWRSLRNAPPFDDLLAQLLHGLAHPQAVELPAGTAQRLRLLLEALRKTRCLLVLDNFETVLQNAPAGHYLPGYEGYGQLLQHLGEGRHQSCLLLTSREKPEELVPLAGETASVRTLTLTSLPLEASYALLQGRGLSGSPQDWLTLQARCSGNPLALKVVAETIRELFLGNISEFLRTETTSFGGIAQLLHQQFARLSALEQELLLWLTVEREPIELEELRSNLVHPPSKSASLQALQALHQRSLVERAITGFTLPSVVMEYLTAYLIEQVTKELDSGKFFLFQRHALLKAQAPSYVRESQRTLILAPIAHSLLESQGIQRSRQHIADLLWQLRHHHPQELGYAGGNLLNLIVYLTHSLQGLDFSQLVIWQADLRGVNAQDTNFYRADLAKSVFTDSFEVLEAVALSPDGELVAAGTMDGKIWLWRISDRQPRLYYKGHAHVIRSVQFDPTGHFFLSASFDQTISLWDTETGQCLQRFIGHTGPVWSACFSADGAFIASAAEDQTVRLWDVNSGQCIRILTGHLGWVTTVCFNPDSDLLASGGTDQTVRIWDLPSGQCLHILQGHTGELRSVCFSPDSCLLASSSQESSVRLWDVASGQCFQVLQGHKNEVRAVNYLPSSHTLVSASYDQTIRLWDPQSGQCLQVLEGHTAEIFSLAFNANGSLLASCGYDQTIRLWQLPSGRCVHTLQGHTGIVWSVCFHPQTTTLISGSFDGMLHWWDVESGRCLHALCGHTGWVMSVSCSPDGATLASGGADQLICLWDLHTGRLLNRLAGHTSIIWSTCFSADGNWLASGSRDKTVRLWDRHTGQCLHIFQGHTEGVSSTCFSPNGQLLISGSFDHTIRIWDLQSRSCLAILQDEATDWAHASIYSVTVSPDGQRLASAHTDQKVRIWDLQSGQCLYTLQEHTGWVISVCFSPDGNILASSSWDETIKLWDTQSGQCLHTLHAPIVTGICFNATGNLLASGSADYSLQVWDIQTAQCIRYLRNDRPYERMNIADVTGLTPVQLTTLKRLGAQEEQKANTV